MTSSCACVYTVLCVKIIRILTILLWLLVLVHFRRDYQMDSQCTQHTRFISQPVSSSLCIHIYMLIFVKMTSSYVCYTALYMYIKIIRILTILLWFLFHFRRDYQMDSQWPLSDHLIVLCKFKFVYPYLYAHLCKWLLLRLHKLFCASR